MINSMFIGISGKAGAGKDTVALYLQTNHSFHRMAFADPLKQAVSKLYGIDLAAFFDRSVKENKNAFWGQSPREIAQFFGTEVVRDKLGIDFWVKRLEYELLKVPKDRVCISDVRFQNELDYVYSKPNGFVIQLQRPGADGSVGIPGHASEQELTLNPKKSFTINNDGTISGLYKVVDMIMNLISKRVVAAVIEDPQSFINSQIISDSGLQ